MLRTLTAAVVLVCAAGVASGRHATGGTFPVPTWPATYNMSRSTIAMPCNDSGYYDLDYVRNLGVVDFDWSNAKALWANSKPMDCQERLVEQASMVKAANPDARVWVYRNLVKALPWYTDVREKLSDPAYSGWFLKFKDYQGPSSNDSYHVPACTGAKCSGFYHDQDQTPQHPHGDGSCTDECDCGDSLPCGEYLWDHRNSSLRDFLINEFVLGPSGLGHPDVDGVFLDDGWRNTSAPIQPWEPKQGFCDHSPIGGPSEEDYHCLDDMGLTQEDTTALTDAWAETIAQVHTAIVDHGGFNWQLLRQMSDLYNDTTSCKAKLKTMCATEIEGAWMLEFTKNKDGSVLPLPNFIGDLANFLLIRQEYAWLGWGWSGCNLQYPFPSQLKLDYGVPQDKLCHETSDGVFTREWTKSTVSMNCNTMTPSISMK